MSKKKKISHIASPSLTYKIDLYQIKENIFQLNPSIAPKARKSKHRKKKNSHTIFVQQTH